MSWTWYSRGQHKRAELTNKAKKKSKKQDHDDWFDFEYQNIRKHNRQIWKTISLKTQPSD